jgi:hypothetical protein
MEKLTSTNRVRIPWNTGTAYQDCSNTYHRRQGKAKNRDVVPETINTGQPQVRKNQSIKSITYISYFSKQLKSADRIRTTVDYVAVPAHYTRITKKLETK